MLWSDEDEGVGPVPGRKGVVGDRSASLERHIFNDGDSGRESLLCALFVGFDEVDDGSMAGVGADEKDVRGVVQLDIVVPQVGQELRGFFCAVLDYVVLFVFLTVVNVGDVPGQVDVDDGKVLLDCPVDVGLDNISLRSEVSGVSAFGSACSTQGQLTSHVLCSSTLPVRGCGDAIISGGSCRMTNNGLAVI